MASAIDICNMALALIGERSISSLDENCKQARLCGRFYTPALKTTLERHHWKFARKRQVLSRSSDTPVFGYKYAYNLPSDYIRELYIWDDETGKPGEGGQPSKAPYDIESDLLLTNLESVSLIYTANTETTGNFSDLFIAAVAYRLAAYLAMPLLGPSAAGLNLQQRMLNLFDDAIPLAQDTDDSQASPAEQEVNPFLRAGGFL